MIDRRWALGALLLPGAASAQEVTGYAEVLGTGMAGVEGVPIQAVERFRPELSARLWEDVLFVGTMELRFRQGRDLQTEVRRTLEESDLGAFLEACTWPEDDNEVLGISGVEDYLAVERFYLDLYRPEIDLRIGRQAVQWGSARFLNPTDPFPEVLLTEPWRPRRGVNAVRATVPLGDLHQVQALLGTDDLFRHERAAVRATLNALQTDFSAVGAWRGDVDGGLVGLDIRGTAGVGFWLEGAVHLRAEEAWEEVVLGIDYSLPVADRLILTAQYYRSGRGAAGPIGGALLGAFEPPDCNGAGPFPEAEPRDPFAPFLTGSDYGFASASLALSQELSITATALQNLGDGTGVALPMVAYYPTGWLELSAMAQVPYSLWGDGGELRPRPEDLAFEGPGGLEVDFSGLVPTMSLILWTRASF